MGGGGQDGCERRINVCENSFFFFGGGGVGSGARVDVYREVFVKIKKKNGGGVRSGGHTQGGCEQRIEVKKNGGRGGVGESG